MHSASSQCSLSLHVLAEIAPTVHVSIIGVGLRKLSIADSSTRLVPQYLLQNSPTDGNEKDTLRMARGFRVKHSPYSPYTWPWSPCEHTHNHHWPLHLSLPMYTLKPATIQDLEFAKTLGKDRWLVSTQLMYDILFPRRLKPSPGYRIQDFE